MIFLVGIVMVEFQVLVCTCGTRNVKAAQKAHRTLQIYDVLNQSIRAEVPEVLGYLEHFLSLPWRSNPELVPY